MAVFLVWHCHYVYLSNWPLVWLLVITSRTTIIITMGDKYNPLIDSVVSDFSRKRTNPKFSIIKSISFLLSFLVQIIFAYLLLKELLKMKRYGLWYEVSMFRNQYNQWVRSISLTNPCKLNYHLKF